MLHLRHAAFALLTVLLAAPALAQKPALASGAPEASARPFGSEVEAFIVADQPSAPTYRPDPSRSYSVSGGDIVIDRFKQGLWRIVFEDLPGLRGGGLGNGGNVQVSALGSDALCVVDVFGFEPFTVFVRCHDPATREQVDAEYTVLFMRREVTGSPTMAYVINLEPGASSTAGGVYSYMPSGAGVPITRTGTGTYTVRFSGLTSAAAAGGHAQVSTFFGNGAATPPVSCYPDAWAPPSDTEVSVFVRCVDGSGALADSRFSVLFLASEDDEPGSLGYAWAFEPTLDTYEVGDGYTFNSSGGQILATRSGTGVYQMTFRDIAGLNPRFNAQVSMYQDAALCNVQDWSVMDADLTVTTHCYDASGAPEDSRYAVLVVSPDRTEADIELLSDDIFTAAPVAVDGRYVGTNVDANVEPSLNPTASCTTNDGGNAVWWAIRPDQEGTITVDLAGSTFDTVLSIVEVGTGEAVESECDDDGIPGDGILTSRIEDFAVQADTRYYVRVTGFNGAEGNIAMSVTSQNASGDGTALGNPPYDDFGIFNTFNINGNGQVIGFDETFPETNVGATSEAGETDAACTTIDGGNSTWRAFAPVQDGFITITLDGSTFDTVLSVRTDIGTEIACDDDGILGDGSLASRLDNIPVTAGTVYHIRVTGYNGASGDIRMRVTGSATPVAADPGAPEASFTLLPPVPNPASGAVRIAAQVAEAGEATVEVFDALGRRVAEIASGPVASGFTEWTWQADVPAGVYIVRLTSGTDVSTQRLTIVR